MKEFHKYLRDIRKAHKELLKDMAAKLGMSSDELFAIEQGKMPIPDNFMMKVRNLYPPNGSIDILLTRKSDKRAIVIDAAQIDFLKPGLFECEIHLVNSINVMVSEEDAKIKKLIEEVTRAKK